MHELFWLSKSQFNRIKPNFPLSYGIPRVDNNHVISGIIYVITWALQWRDTPKKYSPLYPLLFYLN